MIVSRSRLSPKALRAPTRKVARRQRPDLGAHHPESRVSPLRIGGVRVAGAAYDGFETHPSAAQRVVS